MIVHPESRRVGQARRRNPENPELFLNQRHTLASHQEYETHSKKTRGFGQMAAAVQFLKLTGFLQKKTTKGQNHRPNNASNNLSL